MILHSNPRRRRWIHDLLCSLCVCAEDRGFDRNTGLVAVSLEVDVCYLEEIDGSGGWKWDHFPDTSLLYFVKRWVPGISASGCHAAICFRYKTTVKSRRWDYSIDSIDFRRAEMHERTKVPPDFIVLPFQSYTSTITPVGDGGTNVTPILASDSASR